MKFNFNFKGAALTIIICLTAENAIADLHKQEHAGDSSATDLALWRTKVKQVCEECYSTELLVSSMLADSCHIEQAIGETKSVMQDNEMYAFLLGLKNRGVYDNVYSVLVESARNTVDCKNSSNWVLKTKELSIHYLM